MPKRDQVVYEVVACSDPVYLQAIRTTLERHHAPRQVVLLIRREVFDE
jgi:hypothetical protein